MLSSHETCPVCQRELKHAKYINKKCAALDGKAISFVESVCNLVTDEEHEYPRHIFFQVTTLYKTCLMEKIQFPFDSFEVEVNYHRSNTIITYLPKPDPFAANARPLDKIEMKRLLDLDYPSLEKVIKKAKTLALFL